MERSLRERPCYHDYVSQSQCGTAIVVYGCGLSRKEIFLISGLARCHDCGVPDVAAVNTMRGFLHDHRGSRRIGYPTLCQDGALEFILSNDVGVPENVSLRN